MPSQAVLVVDERQDSLAHRLGSAPEQAQHPERCAATRSRSVEVIRECVGAEYYPSIAYDANGKPTVAYGTLRVNQGGQTIPAGLKFARRIGPSWDVEIVDPAGTPYAYKSMAYDPNGNPAIAYALAHDSAYDTLNFAHWNGSSWVPAGCSARCR